MAGKSETQAAYDEVLEALESAGSEVEDGGDALTLTTGGRRWRITVEEEGE